MIKIGKVYTDEFLINELLRFKRENERNPTVIDMQPKFGYPSFMTYINHFGSFNKGLEIAGLPLNFKHRTLDGTETCSYCNKSASEIPDFRQWVYHNNIRYCEQHGVNGIPDYIKGNLDINSETGLGRAGEILVAKTLKVANEFDCNRISCGYKFDLKHEKYGKIDVKTSLLSNNGRDRWVFNLTATKEVKTYICIGLSSDRKNIKHVWIIPNVGEIKDALGITIRDTYHSLSKRKHWEVDSKPYNDMWQTMKLDNCKIMVDKNKKETEEEKRKHEEFKKAYFKKLGITE